MNHQCPHCGKGFKVHMSIIKPNQSIQQMVDRCIKSSKADGKTRNIYLVGGSNPLRYVATSGNFGNVNREQIEFAISSGIIRQAKGYPVMEYFEIVNP